MYFGVKNSARWIHFTLIVIYGALVRPRINRRPWPSVPLLMAVMPLKILGYLRPKKGALFPLGRDALAVLCVPFCVAVMPLFQRLVLPFFRFEYSNNFLPIGIQIFEWTENCDPLIHSTEKKCKTKINNRKVTKLPTAKLIEIAVANCKHGHNFIEILHVSCTKASPIFSGWTRLILFSNSEPPRLRDVVSHLITIETTINTHTHTHTHTHVHTHTHTHTHPHTRINNSLINGNIYATLYMWDWAQPHTGNFSSDKIFSGRSKIMIKFQIHLGF